MATIKPRKLLVPLTGLEPVRILLRGILSPLCLPIPPQRLFNFYKYYNIFYRNCQDLMLVLRSTNRTSHSLFCPVGVIFATISTLVIRLRFELRELWVQSPRRYHFATGYHFYKYYNIFYNICQDFLLAEVRGFEPLNPFRGLSLSKGVFYSHSTTLPTFYKYYIIF